MIFLTITIIKIVDDEIMLITIQIYIFILLGSFKICNFPKILANSATLG